MAFLIRTGRNQQMKHNITSIYSENYSKRLGFVEHAVGDQFYSVHSCLSFPPHMFLSGFLPLLRLGTGHLV